MKRIALGFFALSVCAFANPVSMYEIDPPFTMVAENVLIGVTAEGAVVSGNYRFSVTPNTPRNYKAPYNFAVQLPVPVPLPLANYKDIEALVHPILKIRGAVYHPFDNEKTHYMELPPLPPGVTLVFFRYYVKRNDLGDEFEISIQYDQPIVYLDGKAVVCYVPYLPGFKQYQKPLGLNPHAFVVNVESYKGVTLKLARPVEETEQVLPTLISVYARHLELIEVERVANR